MFLLLIIFYDFYFVLKKYIFFYEILLFKKNILDIIGAKQMLSCIVHA